MKTFLTAISLVCLLPAAAFAQGGDAAAGKALWGGPLQCRNCHGADGEGGFGPDLAGRGLSVSQFAQAVRHPWGIMPAFVDTQLSDAEIANLTAYFASLPKVASVGPWRFATPTSAPMGQQVLHDAGCAQCHGPTFDMPRALLGGVNADFALFKDIVYKHTTTMPEVEESLAAGNPAPAGGGGGGGGNNRLRMGNFTPTRVTEAQLKSIFDWSKDEIGFRPMLQARIVPNGATYNITVTNGGLKGKGLTAQGVKIGLVIPSGIDVVSTTGAGYKGVHMDAEAKGNVAEWDVASLAAKDSVALSITLSKPAPANPQEGLKGMIHWDSPKSKTGPVQVQNFAPPPPGGGRGPGYRQSLESFMKVFPAALCFLLASAPAAFAITVTTADAGAGPESITAAPDGGLILGSATKPIIYRAAKGEASAKPWINVSADGNVTFLGVLADAASNTLYACEIGPRSAPGAPAPSSLLTFDLTSGAARTRWKLPGDSSLCNDIAIGPDKAAYVSDTFNSTIFRVAPGASEGTVFINSRALDGIDGLTFMDGVLYANNVIGQSIWRIPVDAAGKPGNPVNIWTDAPLKGPDGMRAAGGHLFVAENSHGQASMLTITGDTAHVTVVQSGLKAPTAIEPAGDVLWVGDRAADNAVSIPLPH